MVFSLDSVVPWGRTYDEYVRMFDLTTDDLSGAILDCAGGPASFNAEATASGTTVISVDPLYAFSADEIRARIEETCDMVLAQAAANADAYVWKEIPDVQALGARRMEAMERFLLDYPAGRDAGRHVEGGLPNLPEHLPHFNIGLVSHFLFTYSDHFDAEMHTQSILSLSHLAEEVRVFPLVNMDSIPSKHLKPVCESLAKHGCHTAVRTVPYEFQRGGDKMLVVRG